MSREKNFRPREKNLDPIGGKIERLGEKISAGCLFYDLTPGGDHDMCETFAEFIYLLVYCNEIKLYHERDSALKTLQSYMTIE